MFARWKVGRFALCSYSVWCCSANAIQRSQGIARRISFVVSLGLDTMKIIDGSIRHIDGSPRGSAVVILHEVDVPIVNTTDMLAVEGGKGKKEDMPDKWG